MDGHKLWNKFLAYHSLASSLTPQSLECGLTVMWNSDNRQTMLAAYPFIASLLARIAILPASSVEVEQVFSTAKHINSLNPTGVYIRLMFTSREREQRIYTPVL